MEILTNMSHCDQQAWYDYQSQNFL